MKGYEYYKKMAEQAVAIGDYRLSMADLDKRIEAGAVMVGDPEDCLKVAKIYESAGVDLLLMLVQVGAVPHEKVMQTDRSDRQARDAEAQPELENISDGDGGSRQRPARGK